MTSRVPEEDEEDGPLSVPPPGDPDGDAPIVGEHGEESVDDLASPSSPEPFAPADLDEPPPSAPPAWDEAPDLSDDDAHASEVWTLLDPASDVDDDAPFADQGDDSDDDVALLDDLDEHDEPFDPGGDDDG